MDERNGMVPLKVERCFSSGFGGARTGLFSAFALEGEDEQQAHANTNGAIGHVECRKSGRFAVAAGHVKVQKINYVPNAHAINQIPDNAAKTDAKRNLAAQGVNGKMMASPDQ